ncbi:MAG: LUD domain-containing protein, partial [Minisyncoccia bacterium]
MATKEIVTKTAEALKTNGVEAITVETGAEALEKIKELIPKGASVMNGASKTLEQIGYIEYLQSEKHKWNNLHKAIIAEKDRAKQTALRKQASLSDYYLGSVHALAENGEFV